MRFMKVDAVAAVALLGTSALMPTLGLAPARQSRVDAATLSAEAQQLHEQLLQATETTQSIRGAIEREQRVLAELSYQGVERIQLNRRIAMVNAVAERCGLEVIRLSPRRELTRDGQGPARGLDLAAMGDFPGVVQLLEEIESPELALWAESFEIRARTDRPGWVTVSTDLAWHADSAGD